jgi:hypothetical protein
MSFEIQGALPSSNLRGEDRKQVAREMWYAIEEVLPPDGEIFPAVVSCAVDETFEYSTDASCVYETRTGYSKENVGEKSWKYYLRYAYFERLHLLAVDGMRRSDSCHFDKYERQETFLDLLPLRLKRASNPS